MKQNLPQGEEKELIDIGCGTGAFTIYAALKGYNALGLSWDERNQTVARDRALMCKAGTAKFDVQDVRKLDQRNDLINEFDVAICFENIEHIIDDGKLLRDISGCLKPGGKLLMTAPSYDYKPISTGDAGPFNLIEDGGHVRKGYTEEQLSILCKEAGLICESFSFCSGFSSQKITFLLRLISKINHILGWLLTLPLRAIPPVLDPILFRMTEYPGYSICLVVQKKIES